MCMQVCVRGDSNIFVDTKGQLVGAGCKIKLSLLCGAWECDSDDMVWWQMPLPAKPSHTPLSALPKTKYKALELETITFRAWRKLIEFYI